MGSGKWEMGNGNWDEEYWWRRCASRVCAGWLLRDLGPRLNGYSKVRHELFDSYRYPETTGISLVTHESDHEYEECDQQPAVIS